MDFPDQSLIDLVVAASSPVGSPEEVQGRLGAVLGGLGRADRATRDDAVRRLANVIDTAEVDRAALVALGCGALVEGGADPRLAMGPILDRLPAVLAAAESFASACRAEAPGDAGPEKDDDPIESFGERVAERMPDEARAWQAVEPMALAAIAMLSRSPEARRESKGRGELLARADALADVHGRAGFLAKMLQVLDDEVLVVLHPESGRGYRVQIGGIADNFQLHTLLADALIGNWSKTWIPGTRPDPRIVAAAKDRPVDPAATTAMGAFNLVDWRGLKPDGSLSAGFDGREYWIWNEGIPADIPHFEGVRVVLLGPPPYVRSWNAGRIFDGMVADLRVLEVLDAEAARGWLDRIARAPR